MPHGWAGVLWYSYCFSACCMVFSLQVVPQFRGRHSWLRVVMQKVNGGRSDAYFKNKCKMHLVRIHLRHQLLAQKDSSCARICKKMPAVTLNTTPKNHHQARKSDGPAAKSLKRPPAGNKDMNGPPAGMQALPASRIDLLLGSILSGEVFRIFRV